MNNPGTYISSARSAWKLINGIICVYKPPLVNTWQVQKEIQLKLAKCLNVMDVREPETIVEINRIVDGNTSVPQTVPAPVDSKVDVYLQNEEKTSKKLGLEKLFNREVITEFPDGPDTIQIVKGQNLADHTLVVGPRYQPMDVKLFTTNLLGYNTSGLQVIGINNGTKTARRLPDLRWVRTYVLSGRFGLATNTGFSDGTIIDKATYHKISQRSLERYIATTQAHYQKIMFEACGLQLTSERAFEIASKGLPRPEGTTAPIIYSMKCIKFDSPDFEIEVVVINEHENFLVGLIHDAGIRLNSCAFCTKIRSVKYGPFGIDLALLSKHFEPQHIINNIIQTSKILKEINLRVRELNVKNEKSKSQEDEKLQNRVEYI